MRLRSQISFKRLLPILCSFILFAYTNIAHGQLLIDHTMTPEQLVQNVLLGNGVTATNVTYTGAIDVAIGHFDNGNTTNLGLNEGIVLSSGNVDLIPDTAGTQEFPRTIHLCNWLPGDPDLDALPNVNDTHDASILEFDFIPQSDSIGFRYVFGSEEYPTLVNLYNDAFAYFISGPNPEGPAYDKVNIALVPNTDLYVSVDNINNGIANDGPCVNCQYYINNWGGLTIAFNGFTTVLSSSVLVYPDSTYHMKLTIADEEDCSWDSGVFLEAFSFSSTYSMIHTEFSNSSVSYGSLIEGCNDATIYIELNEAQTEDYVIHINVLGSANEGVDYSLIPDSLVIPAGLTNDSIVIEAFADGSFEATESVTIILDYESFGSTMIDTLNFPLLDNNIDFGGLGSLYCQDASPITLWGQPSDGIYSGPGMVNNIFYPNLSNPGTNRIYFTKYFIDHTGASPDTVCTNQLYLDTEIEIAPMAFAGSGTTLCQGELLDFSTLTILPDSSHCDSIRWFHNGLGNLDNVRAIYPIYTPDPNEFGFVQFSLVAYGSSPCTSNTSEMYLVMQGQPIVEAGTNVAHCDNSPYTLSLSSVANYSSLQWASSGDGSFNNSTIEHPVYTPGAEDISNGSVLLTLTAFPNSPCTISQSDSMTLLFGTISEAGSDESICADHFFDFSTSVVLPDTVNCDSLIWLGGLGIFNDSKVLYPIYTPDINEIGNIQLGLVAYSSPPCSNDTSYMILSIEEFPLADAGPDIASCDNTPVHLLATSLNNYNSLLWSSSGDGIFNNTGIEHPIYSPGSEDISSGSVLLTITALPNAPCTSPISDTLTLFLGTLAHAGSDEIICLDQTFDFLTSNVLPDTINCDSIRWIGGSGNFNNPTSLYPHYTPDVNETGTIQLGIVAYGTPPCSNDTSYMNLILQPLPEVEAGSDIVICETENVSLNAMADQYTTLQWSTSGNGTFSDISAISPTYFPGSTDLLLGQVTLRLSVIPITPCLDMVMDSLIVTFERAPIAYAGLDAFFCMEGSVTLSEADTTYASALLWSNFSGDGTFDDATLLHPTYSPGPNELQTGIVHLLLTAYPQGSCSTSSTSEITFDIQPVPTSNAGGDAIICKGDSYPLSG
ncbi:choice-of-anchor L domain-containing protein, partial [Mariniphaga sediminis]|uniref:choice-of-anchor L domain-containing protein n=1 Tax=Mariniphaga sediminis TaxID=1628158 RepID=UPI00356527AF